MNDPDPQNESPQQAGRGRDSSSPGRDQVNRSWYGLLGIGLEFLATICVFGWIGWYLDGRFKTLPWLTIAGGAVGFAAGLAMMIRAALRSFKD